jgi:hypothetical protein
MRRFGKADFLRLFKWFTLVGLSLGVMAVSNASKTGRDGIPMPPILLAGHTSRSQPTKQAMSKDACAREERAKTPKFEG